MYDQELDHFYCHSSELTLECYTTSSASLAMHWVIVRCSASLGGSLSNAYNPTLGLCSGTFLHMTSDYGQTRWHKNY
jgi:hypothetical protein